MEKTLPFTKEQLEAWRDRYPTPFYVYDEAGIRACVERVRRAFAWCPGYREYFAVKATPTPAILRLLASLGCGCDCASETELLMAERCGITGDRVFFSANQTSPREYAMAHALGGVINLDDVCEIPKMEAGCGVPETVCCRYNPGKFAIGNDIIGTLGESKFGMPKDQLFAALKELKEKGARRFGVHAMLASCSLDAAYYPLLARELFSLALEIRETLGITLDFIDLSGGVGIPYRPEQEPVDILAVGEAVHKVYDELMTANGMAPALYTEMGRFITGPYGYLVASVTGEKRTYKHYVGLDATAANLMRPAMYGAYHHIIVPGKEALPKTDRADVVGSLCENNDKFAVDRMLPETEAGDLVVICDAGAHGHAMGYNYNGRLRSAELLLHPDGEVTLIRRAQTVADYFATLDVDEAFAKAGQKA
ncbi:MAG: diaminopimelate decarboxylase [Clostridia bacterium]|nr:diaminopimelate decarboxylase [Clostridia bacterium]